MKIIDNNNVFQILIVVRNAERAAMELSRLFGVPIPATVVLDPEEIAHGIYRGSPTKARAKVIPFKMGPLDVEFIEPDESPSIWREMLEQRGEGVCHIGIMVDDVNSTAEAMEKDGIAAAQKAEFPGGRYAIMDTFAKLGVNLMVKQGQ